MSNSDMILFSDEEIKCLYTLLCMPEYLPSSYWKIKEKVEQYLKKNITLRDLIFIQNSAKSMFSSSNDYNV